MRTSLSSFIRVMLPAMLAAWGGSAWADGTPDGAQPSGTLPADTQAASRPAAEQPLQLKMSGYIEAGASDDLLTSGYPDRHTEFVRGELRTSPTERWTAEINEVTEFGETGTLFVAGYEKQLGTDWIAQAGVATSAGGDTLPRLRLDMALGRKWLEARNLVTTVSVTEIEDKDVHRDHAIQFSTAYFFDIKGWPWAVEGGIRRNDSDPGSNGATSYYAAITSGREKERVVSLRIGAGREAYQLVGANIAIDNFSSNSLLFTWREWLGKDYGFQLRADTYHNPYYERRGVEASWFQDF